MNTRTMSAEMPKMLLLLMALVSQTAAHEHHDEAIPEGEHVSQEPIVCHGIAYADLKDTILWTHIIIQIVSWGIIFPTGMVLGITRSPWHIPTQILGTAGAIVGYFLGHAHGGRQFGHNIHATFAPYLGFILVGQIVLGIYLKLHIERGFLGSIRKVLVITHGVLGKALPVATWVQFLFGGIVTQGFCHDDHLGQCIAHFIMGSAFIGYGIILTILLLVGQFWLRRTGRSQEFFDSLIITIWGCVNTFTEHRWGGPWVRNDLQHTSMGIIWWCAGLLGLWLSRTRDGRPKRNLVPAIVLFVTGYGMSAHPQELMLSTHMHTAFGWTLMGAGAARMIEISFVLKDKAAIDMTGRSPNSFQFLTPFLLFASGFLFMGSTEEAMAELTEAGVTHVSYILLLFSVAFLLFLLVSVLLHLYAIRALPADSGDSEAYDAGDDEIQPMEHVNGKPLKKMNGYTPANTGLDDVSGSAVNGRATEDFELNTLMSDDSEDEADRRIANGGPRQ